jgi:hypothetical protein
MSGQGTLRFRNDRALPLGRRNQSAVQPSSWARRVLDKSTVNSPIPGTCPCPILAAYVKQQRNRGRCCPCCNCPAEDAPGHSARAVRIIWARRGPKPSGCSRRPILPGLFKRLQCFNVQVYMQADRQFLANSRSGWKLLFRFERPTNSLQLRLMSRVAISAKADGRRQVGRGLPRTS